MEITELLVQIDSVGGVSASWVLVIITGVAGSLLMLQLKDIKNTLKDLTDLVRLHEKQIAVINHKLEIQDD